MNSLSPISFVLLVLLSSPFYSNAQFDTSTSVVCEQCPFSQFLLEWDTFPGADELVQSRDSLYFRSNDGTGGFGALQFLTMLPSGEDLVLFEDADGDNDYDLFTHNNGTVHLLRNDGGAFETMLLDTTLNFNNTVVPYDHPDAAMPPPPSSSLFEQLIIAMAANATNAPPRARNTATSTTPTGHSNSAESAKMYPTSCAGPARPPVAPPCTCRTRSRHFDFELVQPRPAESKSK